MFLNIIKLRSTVNSLWSLANCNPVIKLASCEFENSPLPRKEGIDITVEHASFQQKILRSWLGKNWTALRAVSLFVYSNAITGPLIIAWVWTLCIEQIFLLSLNTFLGGKLPLVISRIWTPVCAVVVHLVLPARPIVSDHHFSFTDQTFRLFSSNCHQNIKMIINIRTYMKTWTRRSCQHTAQLLFYKAAQTLNLIWKHISWWWSLSSNLGSLLLWYNYYMIYGLSIVKIFTFTDHQHINLLKYAFPINSYKLLCIVINKYR